MALAGSPRPGNLGQILPMSGETHFSPPQAGSARHTVLGPAWRGERRDSFVLDGTGTPLRARQGGDSPPQAEPQTPMKGRKGGPSHPRSPKEESRDLNAEKGVKQTPDCTCPEGRLRHRKGCPSGTSVSGLPALGAGWGASSDEPSTKRKAALLTPLSDVVRCM
jgi:hypothetical protein